MLSLIPLMSLLLSLPSGLSESRLTTPSVNIPDNSISSSDEFLELTTDGTYTTTYISDVNECQVDNGFCQHVCVNLVGSYSCSCNEGYALADDDHTCVDHDECEGNSTCSSDEACINTPGAFECLKKIFEEHTVESTFYSPAQGEHDLVSVPMFVGYFIWLTILTLMTFVVGSVIATRRSQIVRVSSKSCLETPFSIESAYEPREEEQGDQHRNTSRIVKRCPPMSINPSL